MPVLSLAVLAACFPSNPEPAAWLAPMREATERFDIDTAPRLAGWLAQVGHESADATKLSESLDYSVSGLLRTFPARVPAWLADRIGRKPGRPADQYAIAEAVYGRRMGNDYAGDGYKYRGAGLLGVTGFTNHDLVAQAFDLATEDVPDWLRTKLGASLSAAWFWHESDCNRLADAGDIDAISRRINGGSNGLDDRRSRYARARKALGL